MLFVKKPSPWRYLKPLLYISPAILGYLIICLAKINASATETIYSRNLFFKLRSVTSPFGRLTPFSLAGVLLGLAGISVLAFLFHFIWRILALRSFSVVLWHMKALSLTLSSIFFIFALTCAPNYHRLTFSQLSGLTIRESSVQELALLCKELIEQANFENAQPEQHSLTFLEAGELARENYNQCQAYDFLGQSVTTPKKMPVSELLSYLNLTGFYFPYTGEATVNAHMPMLEIPFTMCHELAHTNGFMREDEANFIAYLVCRDATSTAFRYSGTVCALNNSMNALYRYSPEAYFALRNFYGQQLSQDIEQQSQYWQGYDTPAAAVSTAVNNAYLKANNQSDGTHSYGRMVDLLLADYRDRHQID